MAEVDQRVASFGHVDLGLLGARGQLVPEALGDDGHQPLVVHGVGVEDLHLAQLHHPLRRVHGVDEVPGGQVEIHRARDLARWRAVHARPVGAVAEFAQDAGQLHAPVEIGAGHVHPVVGEDVVLAIEPGCALRPDAHHREVRGAAADVGHQHQLLARHGPFVVEGGGDRLVLELQLLEPHRTRRRLERRLRLRVAGRIVVHEEHRAAQDGAMDRRPRLGFGAGLQVAEVARRPRR